MNFIEKLLSEGSDVSCMRLMSILSLLIGAILTFYIVRINYNLSEATPVIGIFVGSAFGGKIWQKTIENKDRS